MTPQQAYELKIKVALFAQATAMLEHAKGPAKLAYYSAERDRARNDLYNYIDELTKGIK